MKTAIAIFSILFIGFVLVLGGIKFKKKEESKLSIFEHPDTFEKPNIETVTKHSTKNDDADSIHYSAQKNSSKKS
jgi:hypothetical protein